MHAGLDSIFNFLSMLFDKLEEINPTPYIISAILLAMMISIIVQLKQMVKVTERFNKGAIDNKTVKQCVRFRKRFILPKSAELHDQFCCSLCSMYMERNEEDLFFDNINDIKKLTAQTERRLYLLLVAYLTKQRYLDWSEKHRTTRIGEQTAADWLKTQDITYDADRLASAAKRITNPHALAVLKALTEEA